MNEAPDSTKYLGTVLWGWLGLGISMRAGSKSQRRTMCPQMLGWMLSHGLLLILHPVSVADTCVDKGVSFQPRTQAPMYFLGSKI